MRATFLLLDLLVLVISFYIPACCFDLAALVAGGRLVAGVSPRSRWAFACHCLNTACHNMQGVHTTRAQRASDLPSLPSQALIFLKSYLGWVPPMLTRRQYSST